MASVFNKIAKRLPKGGSLGQKVLNAGGWNIGGMMVQQMLKLFSNLLLTRILLPEAFGVMALIVTVHTACQMFTDIGIEKSLQREKDGTEPRFLRVAWGVQILRTGFIGLVLLVLSAFLWLFGPGLVPAGTVYAAPELPGMLAISALVPIMHGLQSTNMIIASRRLEFRRVIMVDLTATVTGLVCMAGLALIYPTVWALLSGMMMVSVVKLVASHTLFSGPAMRFETDPEIRQRLWVYGKWVLISSPLTFLAMNGDRLILAGLIDPTLFGFYSIALTWLMAGVILIHIFIGKVGHPTMAEILRERPDELPRLFRKFQRIVDTLCIIAFLGCYFLSGIFIKALYTPLYHDAVDYLVILSPIFLSLRFASFGTLVTASGNSWSGMVLSACHAVAIWTLLPLGFMLFGLPGAMTVFAISGLAGVPYILKCTRPLVGKTGATGDYLWLFAAPAASLFILLTH
ncbi:MAG: O-antigen/teichoic acid export membrane protein [Paracoccaceae bacterium]|jgi:O-antigen/teichoic acid export membrane protein